MELSRERTLGDKFRCPRDTKQMWSKLEGQKGRVLVEVSVLPGPVINTQKLCYLQYFLANHLSVLLASSYIFS